MKTAVLVVLLGLFAVQLVPSNGYYSYISFSLVHAPLSFLLRFQHRALCACGLAQKPVVNQPKVASDTNGKVAIITGSNTGIGFETARSLAVDYGMEVILACRSQSKAEAAIEKIKAHGGEAKFVGPLDLTNSESIKSFVQAVKDSYERVDVLVNNAGRNTSPPSENGRDVLFASNFLGHFELTGGLIPLLRAGSARIVNLSSVMHHVCTGCEVDQVEFWGKVIDAEQKPKNTYNVSKLAAILFTIALRHRYPDISSFAVNPGAVNSDIWRDLPSFLSPALRLLFLTNTQGCSASVAAAVHDFGMAKPLYLQPYYNTDLEQAMMPFREVSGPYVGFAAAGARLPQDGGVTASKSLWEVCTKATQVKWQ